MLRAIQEMAPSFGVTVQDGPVHDDAEIETKMLKLAREERSGVVVLAEVFTAVHRGAIISSAARHRIPAVYSEPFFVTSGGLMSYGVDGSDLFRRAASYVDRVLKGAKPAELPVQTPTKFNLFINLKAAKALDLTIPPTLLAQADEVIE